MIAENRPAPPPACTMSSPPGRNFGSVRVAQRTRACPRRCRRRRGRCSAPRAAGSSWSSVAQLRPRPSPLRANTRACSGPTTRIASKPSTSFGWCTRAQARGERAGQRLRRRATAGRRRPRALAGEQRDASRRPARSRARPAAAPTASRPRPRRSRTRACPGCRRVARSTPPGRPPPTLRMTSCSARPIVELARLPWPSALTPEFMPMRAAIGR